MSGSPPAETARRLAERGPSAAARGWAAALVLCAVLSAIVAASASAQDRRDNGDDERHRRGGPSEMPAYCSVVAVDKVQLSNATIVTVKANGLLKTDAEFTDFMEEEEPGEWDEKMGTRFPIRILNARSQIGSFVDIDMYPL
ncbi:MAG: hypothetical protein ACE5JM_15600, partial [Armatimonadota bacterium]